MAISLGALLKTCQELWWSNLPTSIYWFKKIDAGTDRFQKQVSWLQTEAKSHKNEQTEI